MARFHRQIDFWGTILNLQRMYIAVISMIYAFYHHFRVKVSDFTTNHNKSAHIYLCIDRIYDTHVGLYTCKLQKVGGGNR